MPGLIAFSRVLLELLTLLQGRPATTWSAAQVFNTIVRATHDAPTVMPIRPWVAVHDGAELNALQNALQQIKVLSRAAGCGSGHCRI